jgi:hypothetical protein
MAEQASAVTLPPIPKDTLEREKQKGGNNGDDCAGKK